MGIADFIDAKTELWQDVSSKIWDYAELGLIEFKSSKLLAATLEKQGFSVQRGVGGMATAFVASRGQGGPVIGFLGEFDALPGLSQRHQPTKEALTEGAPGHGCGHNLLGTGAMAAAVALAEELASRSLPGTVRFYGCPAEETLDGKAFMSKAGVFDDVDIAITWHPGDFNTVNASSSQAMNGARFTFHGVAAHAAANPELGRSALDAIELMNVGVNFMREHVPQDARIHYVILNGGEAPNVVPPVASSWYYVRAPKRATVEELYARVCNIARGAAMMTDCQLDIELMGGCWDVLPNQVIGEQMLRHLRAVGATAYSDDEFALAASLQETFPENTLRRTLDDLRAHGFEPPAEGSREAMLHQGVLGHFGLGETMPGSTDVGDVSHVTPTAQITTATAPIGTPGHSWQNVVSVGSGIGQRAMRYAAKVMALTGLDFVLDPKLVQAARREFEQATRDDPYRCAVDKLVALPHIPAGAPWRA